MLKIAHYSAVGRNGAGLYSDKTLFVYSGDTGFQRWLGCWLSRGFPQSLQVNIGMVPEHLFLPTFYISVDQLNCLCYVVFLTVFLVTRC